MSAGAAWYVNAREAFVRDPIQAVVGQLASSAAAEGLHVEADQHEEWRASVGVLLRQLHEHTAEIELLKSTLASDELIDFRHVLLEFDFKRRGLRMDCVLLGDGIVAIVEFKRTKLSAADREQVTNYAVNLVEFHEETRRLIEEEQCIVAPLLTLTAGTKTDKSSGFRGGFLREP